MRLPGCPSLYIFNIEDGGLPHTRYMRSGCNDTHAARCATTMALIYSYSLYIVVVWIGLCTSYCCTAGVVVQSTMYQRHHHATTAYVGIATDSPSCGSSFALVSSELTATAVAEAPGGGGDTDPSSPPRPTPTPGEDTSSAAGAATATVSTNGLLKHGNHT